MSQPIVARSFAELAEILGQSEDTTEPSASLDPDQRTDGGADSNLAGDSGETTAENHLSASERVDPPDLAGLLAELEAASRALGDVVRRDQAAREEALRDLDRYDALSARLEEAREARGRAQEVRSEAEALAQGAFTSEARGAAERVVGLATLAEEAAGKAVRELEAETKALAQRLDLARLIEERQREEELAQARAAELAKARRLSATLASAREAIEAGKLEEAKALLGTASNENPDDAEVASLNQMRARRELVVKVSAAESTLFAARRQYREEPASALARLAALDVAGLPEPLSRQAFGEWARIASRLCRERGLGEPLRYAPDPGRGVIVARQHEHSPYIVVAALGMGSTHQEGQVAPDWLVRRARPLR